MSIADRCWLECGHCGSAAIISETGYFYDGDGGECMCCEFPGHVSCDAETDPYWVCGEEQSDKCNNQECEDCRP